MAKSYTLEPAGMGHRRTPSHERIPSPAWIPPESNSHGTVRPSSVAMSYTRRQPPSEEGSDQYKLSRRPVPGKSVAALQQRWMGQEGLSPSGSIRSNASSSNSSAVVVPRMRSPQPAMLVMHPDEDSEEDDDEEEVMEVQDEAEQDRYASSMIRVQQGPVPPPRHVVNTASTQEFRVAKEGWMYRKNSLMQWKLVYAVAKHGNSIKPGALYLYKDEKFSNHIQTYDMSQVVEVEPRAQEYKAGIKWEFRVLVKREDVLLATDDIQARKEWIDALSSIMGKVSMATHSELQTRVASTDHANRELQNKVEALQAENAKLRDQMMYMADEAAHKDNEQLEQQKALTADFDQVQQALEMRCDQMEHELAMWQDKAHALEELQKEDQVRIQGFKAEIAHWRARVDELEKKQKPKEEHLYRHGKKVDPRKKRLARTPSTRSSRSRRLRDEEDSFDSDDDDFSSISTPPSEEDTVLVRNTMLDVKYNLQSLHEQMQKPVVGDPVVQGHVVDIKSGVEKVQEALDAARKELGALLESKNAEVMRELVGDADDSTDAKLTLASKLDGMAQAMELLQTSQAQLLERYLEAAEKKQSEEAEAENARIATIQAMLEEWQEGRQEALLAALQDTRAKESEDTPGLSAVLAAVEDLKEAQTQSKEDYDHSLKVLGQLLQHVLTQVEANAVPELAEQMEMLSQRFSEAMEQRRKAGGVEDAEEAEDKQEMRSLMVGTRSFIERTLRVLDRYDNDGVEDTVRRAVKSAFNSHAELFDPKKDDKENEEKLRRYEENARGYIDKSMTGMRDHLEEYTGVMYKMIEELILRAVDHLDQSNQTQNNKLREQEQDLDDLRRAVKEVERELSDKRIELRSVQTEYDNVLQAMERAQREKTTALSRDLEPLMEQIMRLKRLVEEPVNNGAGDERYSSSFRRPSNTLVDTRPQLTGGRERPRATSPLPGGGFLGRK